MDLKTAQAALREELVRLERQEAERALDLFCKGVGCERGNACVMVDKLFSKLQRHDMLESENHSLEEENRRLRERNLDFSKVEATLARLKEAGTKVVDLRITIETKEDEK